MIRIQILGTGCPKCDLLAKTAHAAAKEMGLEYELIKVKDIQEITGFGVMITPALAVNDQVKMVGKVPSLDQIKEILRKA